jgi:hypothetical protein
MRRCDESTFRSRIITTREFEDGTTFELQAPDAFTQEQVVEMAEQVTFNP